MVELLELAQAGLTLTAITIAAVTVPVAIVTDTELPDITPLVEVLHTKYHMDADADAHGFCGQKEFVKELKMFYENNAY